MNVVMPTMGGKQLWADERFYFDWHIQQNVLTGHYRLLDGNDRRHAWGTLDQCATKLEEIKQQQNLPPMSGKACVLLHGLFRSDDSMSRMANYLRDKGNYLTINVTYPSTQAAVGEHAARLERIINHLHGVEEINFVAHSLGNLVIRNLVANQCDRPQREVDPRIKRMVMLGPPNQGACIAQALLKNDLGELIAGKSGQQLACQWQQLSESLAVPPFEFGIIAGGMGGKRGYNPFLPGDNDAVVEVDSTKLPGATDFVVLPVIHSTMMNQATIQEYTLRFLQHGYFKSPEERNPLGNA
jgi:pimeloyl-ACP methyl ester carboxylesterase